MTVQDLINKIDRLIDAEIAGLEKETRQNYLSIRRQVSAAVKSLWTDASIAPRIDDEIGGKVYTSLLEAKKYGRLEKLDETVKGVVRRGAVVDIQNLQNAGLRVYETQYNGYAWAYSQGYGLPITGGANVKLAAASIFSDFYGRTAAETVKKNLGKYADDILAACTRELNQGHSYSQIAKTIQGITDLDYKNALVVARTEAGRIQSDAYLDSVELLNETGVKSKKKWVSTIDSTTREDHVSMDGKEADERGIFHLPDGSTGPSPRKTGSAAQDINCRCTAITVIEGLKKPSERRVRGEDIVPYETFTERNKRLSMTDVAKNRNV
jgi:SPP1 gp7 family putative phage head morphogenesis protein